MRSTIYRNKKPLIFFLVPAFSFLVLYLYYPFVMNIINSASDITGLGTGSEGLNDPWYSNYLELLKDPHMATALKNSMYMLLATIVFQLGIALFLAILVDNITKGAQVFRTLYFLPIIISATALGLMFNIIFLYNGGMINQFLTNVGWITKNIDWKSDSNFMFTMFSPVMWQYVGFYFVILVTGLNNISGDIYEAAKIDGATGIERVRYITLPLLRNVLCTCMVLIITGSLKVFDLPWVMMGTGVPMDQSWLLGTYMYNHTMLRNNVDYGSAIALVIVVFGVVISKISNTIFKEVDY